MVTKICVGTYVWDIYHRAKFYPNRYRGFGSAHAWFRDPQKALRCAEPRRLTYFVSKSVRLSSRLWPFSRTKKIAESLCAEGREITHAQNRNPYTDLDKILHGGRYPRRRCLHKFWWPSVKGFLNGVASNFPLSHRLSSSPLQHSRTTVRACDDFLILPALYVDGAKSMQQSGVRLSVPSFYSSSVVTRMCCWAPRGQDNRSRAGSGAQQQRRRSMAHSGKCSDCHVDSRASTKCPLKITLWVKNESVFPKT